MKSERNFNVVLTGLHYSTPVEDIAKEIELQGHQVINVSNIKQRSTKKPLSMFWVNLKPDSYNKDVYNITILLHTKVAFEPPKKSVKYLNAPDVKDTDTPLIFAVIHHAASSVP